MIVYGFRSSMIMPSDSAFDATANLGGRDER